MKNPFLLKEIRSKEGVLHFKRWGIETRWFNVYVHGIYQADEEKHMHDHPWDYTSIVLKGSFVEQRPSNSVSPLTILEPGSVVRRKAEGFHKIYELITPAVYTLFFTGPRRRSWGYDVDGRWINNHMYRVNKRNGKYD